MSVKTEGTFEFNRGSILYSVGSVVFKLASANIQTGEFRYELKQFPEDFPLWDFQLTESEKNTFPHIPLAHDPYLIVRTYAEDIAMFHQTTRHILDQLDIDVFKLLTLHNPSEYENMRQFFRMTFSKLKIPKIPKVRPTSYRPTSSRPTSSRPTSSRPTSSHATQSRPGSPTRASPTRAVPTRAVPTRAVPTRAVPRSRLSAPSSSSSPVAITRSSRPTAVHKIGGSDTDVDNLIHELIVMMNMSTSSPSGDEPLITLTHNGYVLYTPSVSDIRKKKSDTIRSIVEPRGGGDSIGNLEKTINDATFIGDGSYGCAFVTKDRSKVLKLSFDGDDDNLHTMVDDVNSVDPTGTYLVPITIAKYVHTAEYFVINTRCTIRSDKRPPPNNRRDSSRSQSSQRRYEYTVVEMEYAPYGDLSVFLDSKFVSSHRYLMGNDGAPVLRALHDVVNACAFLQDKEWVHGDVKMSNALVFDRNGRTRLNDYDFLHSVHRIPDHILYSYTCASTQCYNVPPEYIIASRLNRIDYNPRSPDLQAMANEYSNRLRSSNFLTVFMAFIGPQHCNDTNTWNVVHNRVLDTLTFDSITAGFYWNYDAYGLGVLLLETALQYFNYGDRQGRLLAMTILTSNITKSLLDLNPAARMPVRVAATLFPDLMSKVNTMMLPETDDQS